MLNVFLGSFGLRNHLYNRTLWNIENQNNPFGTLIEDFSGFLK